MKTDTTIIHPEDSSNIHYWSKKWGVSNSQLNDAIINTGSLNPVRVREYLRTRKQSLLFNLLRFLKPKNNALH
jgi:hypothetical protein